MNKLKGQLVIFLAWVSCFCKVHCEDNPALLDKCTRLCSEARSTGKSKDFQSEACMRDCLLKAKEKSNAVTQPATQSSTPELSLNLTPTETTPNSTKVPVNDCPSGAFHKPRSNEVIPGDVSDVTVTFVQQTKENSQGWLAKVNWTAPKDVNISLNWRGYLVVWTSTGNPGLVRCKMLPKDQLHLNVNETEEWKYPNKLFLAVIPLPMKRESVEMEDFDPKLPDWGSGLTVHGKGGKHFRLQLPEGISVVIVAGFITGLAIVWVVNIYIIKRKSFKGYHVVFTCTTEKKAGKKADGQKDQLIV